MPYGIGGALPGWNSDDTTNRLKQSYVKDFIDISGSLVLRNNANLYVEGNTTVNGKLLLNNTNLQADLSFNNRILVGGDMSMNGNTTIANDVSLNGVVTGCIFNNNSIPTNAFVGTVTAGGPDYTKASVIYQQKFRADGDVSMNGSTVQATNITVKGNIEFNDGTKMSTYDDNVDSQSISSTNIETGNATTTSKSFSTPSTTNTSLNLSNGEVFGCCRISLDGQIAVIVRGDNAYWMGASNLLFDDVGLYITRNGGTDWELKKMQDVSATIITSKMSLGGFSMSSDGIHMCLSVTTTSGNKPQTPYLFYSHNTGVDWTRIVNGSLGFNSGTIIGMSAISDNGQYMYVTTYEQGAIIRSADSGLNGTAFSTGGRIFPYTQIVCSRNGQKVLSRWQQDSNRQYTYSSNYGANYANINVNAPTDIQNICANADLTKIIIGHINSDNITIFSGADLTVLSNWTYYSAFSTAFGTTFNSVVYRPDGRICASSDLRYIIIGCNSSTTQSIFSNNYGVTWSQLILPAARLTSSKYAMALSDSGKLIYVNSTKDGIVVMNISATKLFKASTFSNLTIKGTLSAGTFVVSSDYRIKNNVAKLDNTFTVDNLRPVKYFQTLLNKKQYGLIAHELQQYYPDLVLGEKDGHNLQSVNYTGLIAILINEIIRLEREFTELEKKRQISYS